MNIKKLIMILVASSLSACAGSVNTRVDEFTGVKTEFMRLGQPESISHPFSGFTRSNSVTIEKSSTPDHYNLAFFVYVSEGGNLCPQAKKGDRATLISRGVQHNYSVIRQGVTSGYSSRYGAACHENNIAIGPISKSFLLSAVANNDLKFRVNSHNMFDGKFDEEQLGYIKQFITSK